MHRNPILFIRGYPCSISQEMRPCGLLLRKSILYEQKLRVITPKRKAGIYTTRAPVSEKLATATAQTTHSPRSMASRPYMLIFHNQLNGQLNNCPRFQPLQSYCIFRMCLSRAPSQSRGACASLIDAAETRRPRKGAAASPY
jgi:hypothetical protein